jgi:hypothetical protein
MGKKAKHVNDLGSFWENFIIVSIILVLAVTLLDEIATIQLWSLKMKNILLYAGFIFDIIFTAEFLIRYRLTSRQGLSRQYIMHERGWIDFISSVPLLLFNSGPEIIILLFPDLFHGGENSVAFFGTIKVVKAIRVTRILRLLRMIKILGKIQNTDSVMANRHLSVISTTVVISMILGYAGLNMSGFMGIKRLEEERKVYYQNFFENSLASETAAENIKKFSNLELKNFIATLFYDQKSAAPEILHIYYKNQIMLSNYTQEYVDSHFLINSMETISQRFHDPNLFTLEIKDYFLVLNLHSIHAENSRIQLMIFLIIISVILSLLFIYSRHFVQNVTDLIHVMKRGFMEKDYMLEVKIRDQFDTDEIFVLAKDYNEKWLPEKAKKKHENPDNQESSLSMDDFLNQ